MEKTAQPLIEAYGSVEGIYENLHAITRDTVRNKLADGRDLAFLSKELVTIHTEVPLLTHLEDCKPIMADAVKVDQLLSLLNFNTLRRKWAMKTSGTVNAHSIDTMQELAPALFDTVKNRKHDYVLVKDTFSLQLMIHEIKNAPSICFDLETTSLDTMNCSIVGFALSSKVSKAFLCLLKMKT